MINIIDKFDSNKLIMRGININIKELGINIFREYLKDYEYYFEKRLNSYKHSSEEYLTEIDFFTNIFRPSFFIMLYSFLEINLEKICYTFQDRYNFKDKFIDVKDRNKYKGNLLQKIQSYLINNSNLVKIYPINFPNNNDDWYKLSIVYNRLRNNIVHNDRRMPKVPEIKYSQLSRKKENQYNKIRDDIEILGYFIEKNPLLIKIDNLGRFNLSKEFLIDVINTIESFFNKFMDAWRTWIT